MFVLFGILIIRFIGMLIFIDFFFQYRKDRYLYLVIAFIFFCLSPILDIISDSLGSDFIFILSEICLTTSIFLFIFIFLDYNVQFKFKLPFTIIIISLIIIFGISSFLLFSTAITFDLIQFIDLVLIFSIFPYIYRYFSKLQIIISNFPIIFLTTLIFSSINIFVTLIQESNLITFTEVLSRIGYSILVPIVFLHFEYALLDQDKFNLKDKYSHDLAQILQIITLRAYLLSQKTELEECKDGFKEIEDKCNQVSELITSIRGL